MAVLDILIYPDPRLRQRAGRVADFGRQTQQLIDDMVETMYAAQGIGLAATQVNEAKQIIVIDISPDKSNCLIIVNPKILQHQGLRETEEGCLSVPGVYAPVSRSEHIRLQAQDRDGNEFIRDYDDMLGICIQHEMDHLDGKVFVDYLSRLKQERIRKRLLKERKAGTQQAVTA